MKLKISLFFLLLLILYAGYFSLEHGLVRFNYPSIKDYPVQGLDVSHHQGQINWQDVDNKKLKFVFIKATEGGDFIDKRFSENWAQAQQAGLVVGAYHFYTFCRPIADQFDNLSSVVPAQKGTLPPALDLEFGGNCKKRLDEKTIKSDIRLFSSKIKQHYGKKPILYMTRTFYKHYNMKKFEEHKIWFRNIYIKPRIIRHWSFWQFTNRGLATGIADGVDMNVFKGSEEDFKLILQ